MSARTAFALLLGLLVSATPASAITAKDVMEKMDQKQRFGYLSGLIDMLAYTAILAGDRPRAECMNKFFGEDQKNWRQVLELFGKYPDKAPEGLIVVLANRACKK